MVLAVALLVGPTFAIHGTPGSQGDDGHVSCYPSTQFMARHIGCADTFAPAAAPGAATSAGTCTLPDGVQVAMRIYSAEGSADAWLDGARGESIATSAGATGGNWAVMITGTRDRDRVNKILTSLP